MDLFIVITIGLHVISMCSQCTDCHVLSTCFLPIYNQECEINCTTPDQSKIVAFYKLPDETNIFGQCFGNTCQIGNHISNTKYSIRSTDSTTTTLLINNLSWDDKGTWRCDYGVTPNTTVLGFAKYPDEIESSSLSNNSEVFSGTEMSITMKCLYTEISTSVTLIYVSNGQSARSTPATCTDTTSSCANNNFVSKLCRPIIQVGTGVVCDGNYSIEIATSVLGNEERKYSVLTGITIKCKVSKEIEEISDEKVVTDSLTGHTPGTGVLAVSSGIIQIYARITFTFTVAELWYFSNQYIIFGTVVYGIQIVLVSAVINTVTIAIGVGVLLYYCGQIKIIVILYIFLLITAFSIFGVSIYMLIVICFGNKDFMHIKCKKRGESKKLSAHGMKLTNDKNICIYFKVKAIYASITLHIIEHVGSKPKRRQLKRVLPNSSPPQKFLNDLLDDSTELINRNASHTEYQSFHLKCENKTKTITVFDAQYKQIEQWTISADSFEIGDIEISNIKQDDSTKDDSTKVDSSTDNSTEKEPEKLDTQEQWKVWFREGDTLCEIKDHEREIKEDLRFKQTIQLICVIILPIAWLVMIVLIVRYLLKSKGKKADDIETESNELQNQKQKDTKGKWFDFTSFSCCHNSVKPNSTTDNKPKALPGSYLANSPKGRNLPKLPEIVTQGNEIRKTKKKDKKKKKIKNQDSNMNDKQCDNQDITFQPEIAVAADTLEAE